MSETEREQEPQPNTEYKTFSSVRKREMQIKSWKKRSSMEKLLKDFKI